MFMYFFTIKNMYMHAYKVFFFFFFFFFSLYKTCTCMHAYKTLPTFGGGTSCGEMVLGAKRLGLWGETTNVKIEAKRLGGKTSWGRNDLLPFFFFLSVRVR